MSLDELDMNANSPEADPADDTIVSDAVAQFMRGSLGPNNGQAEKLEQLAETLNEELDRRGGYRIGIAETKFLLTQVSDLMDRPHFYAAVLRLVADEIAKIPDA